jgi:hypothetical protein
MWRGAPPSPSSSPRVLILVSVARWDTPYVAHSRKDAAATTAYSSTVWEADTPAAAGPGALR